MPDRVIGREPELAAAGEFIAQLERGPAVLVYAGEPGIGKTAVWQEAGERARASSLLLLSARPVEAEAGLAFSGLADLLESVVNESWQALPEPQRRALAVALLKEAPGPGRLDQRAVAAATRTVLQTLAGKGPVVARLDNLTFSAQPIGEHFTARLAITRYRMRHGRPQPVGCGVVRRLSVEDWAGIRRLHFVEGLGIKTIAKRLGVARNTGRSPGGVAARAARPPPIRATLRRSWRDEHRRRRVLGSKCLGPLVEPGLRLGVSAAKDSVRPPRCETVVLAPSSVAEIESSRRAARSSCRRLRVR
jgi:hypothetical protein